jgi:hypothetical protein
MYMSNTICVNQTEGSITINLIVKNPDLFSLVVAEPPESQLQIVEDVIAVGSTAMQRVRTTVDVDFVEKRLGALSNTFEKSLTQLERRSIEAVTQRFSPTESGSYIRHLEDLITAARKDMQSWQKNLETQANSLLDPDKKTSAAGRLDELVRQATSSFEQMFNPGNTTSYAYKLNQQLSQVFGTNGHAGVLQAALQDSLKPIFAELNDLKQKIGERKAAELVIESSTLKGKPFEERVHEELARIAAPYADDVQNVASGSNGSRAGDFLVALSGFSKSVVVEARNRKQPSLPSIKGDLDREMQERAADFAIYVASGPEMLPQHVGEFNIYGNKVVGTIDTLHIAYRLVRVLAATTTPDGSVDVGSIRSVLTKVRDAARSLRTIKAKATQVENLGETIGEHANQTEGIILGLIDTAEKLLEPSKPAQCIGVAEKVAHVS